MSHTPPDYLQPVPSSSQPPTKPPADELLGTPPPESSFNQWLRKLGLRLASILAMGIVSTIGSTIYSAVKDQWYLPANSKNLGWLIPVINMIQMGVIVFVLISSVKGPSWLHDDAHSTDGDEPADKPKEKNVLLRCCGYENLPASQWKEAKNIARKVEDQYQILWKCLWFSWLLLYIILTVQNIPNFFTDPTNVNIAKKVNLMVFLDIMSTLFNNCAAVIILLTYYVLTKPTAALNKKPNKLYEKIAQWTTIAFVFTVIEAVFLVMALGVFGDTSINHTQETLVYYKQVRTVFSYLSGILSATAMALYVGRIDSKFLGTPSWVLVILYVYAAIQPLYALLGGNLVATLLLLNLALIFKCIWFLYTAWLFHSHRLIFYFIRIRRLYQVINNDWMNFSIAIKEL